MPLLDWNGSAEDRWTRSEGAAIGNIPAALVPWEVLVEALGPERTRVRIEMRYSPQTRRDRILVNPALARLRLRFDLAHFRRRVEEQRC